MERRPYPAAGSYALMRAVFLTVPAGFGVFCYGAYLETFRNIEWATTVAGLSSVVVFGSLGWLLQRHYLSKVRCPLCGTKSLDQVEDDSLQQLLVCRDCEIEWDTGISNDHSSS